MKWTWKDIEEIGSDLARRYPGMDPLGVKPSELKELVTRLPTFGDDPDASTAAILEAIQAAWYDELEG
jgi:FeS assembly protein IscX